MNVEFYHGFNKELADKLSLICQNIDGHFVYTGTLDSFHKEIGNFMVINNTIFVTHFKNFNQR